MQQSRVARTTVLLTSLLINLLGLYSHENTASAAGPICGQLVWYTPTGQSGVKFSKFGIKPWGSNETYDLAAGSSSSDEIGNSYRFTDPVVVSISAINTEDRGRMTQRIQSYSRKERIDPGQTCAVQAPAVQPPSGPRPQPQPQPPFVPPQPQPVLPVPVVPEVQPSISFSANPSVITDGQCSTLSWDVENVRAIYQDGQGVPGRGTRLVCPPVTTRFDLRIVTNNGEVTRSVTIYVSSAPPPRSSGSTTITTDKSQVIVGEQLNICYTVTAPAHIEITVSMDDGSSRTFASADDDGRGGCFQGTGGEPLGNRRLRLVVTSGNAVIATAETSYVVLSTLPAVLAPAQPPAPQPAAQPPSTVTSPVPLLPAKWPKEKLPIPVYFDSTVPDDWKDEVVAAVDSWNKGMPAPVLKYQGSTQIGFNANVIVVTRSRIKDQSWTDGFYTEPGRTCFIDDLLKNWDCGEGGLKALEGTIRGSRVEIRDNFNLGWFFVSWGPKPIAGVIRHELGHALGLAHIDQTSDLMCCRTGYPNINNMQVVSDADRQSLKALYFSP